MYSIEQHESDAQAMLKEYIPNIVTSLRIAGSIGLLFCAVTTDVVSLFWSVFLFCGLTDMVDGSIARYLGVESRLGAMLDSVADLCFIVCCALTLFPILILDGWMWGWIVLIVIIKIVNQISALLVHRRLVFPHTIANKVTGLLLFICIPIYVCFALDLPIVITAIIATFAAIQEGHYIRKSKKNY